MPKRKFSERIVKGKKLTIEAAVQPDGSVPALEYYDGLSTGERAKFWPWFEIMANEALVTNKEKFRKLEDEIFEFKAGQHRILCFWIKGGKLVLTNGYFKQSRKSQKVPQNVLDRAKRIRQEYIKAENERG